MAIEQTLKKDKRFDEESEPLDDVLIAPSWSIEILSPLQSSNRVTGNILHV